MAKTIDITVKSSYSNAGVRAAIKDADALHDAVESIGDVRVPKIPDQSAPLKATGEAAAKAAKEALNLAQAEARLATEQQRAAGAAQRLATEQQRTVQATANAAVAQVRAEKAARSLATAQERVGASATRSASGMQILPRTIAGLSDSALRGVTALTGIGSALAAVGKGAELAQLGAQAQTVESQFTRLAKAAGTTGDALMDALRSASGGEIDDLNLQLAANRGMMLGVADSAEEFSTLMAIARDRAQALGVTTGQAFNDLVTGLGRGSAEILDNLGIMVNAEEVYKNYAASVGKSVTALDAAEKKQALINAVVAQGQSSLATTGGAADGAASSFAQLATGASNAQIALGKLIATNLEGWAGAIGRGLNVVAQGLNEFGTIGDRVAQVSAQVVVSSGGYDQYAQKIQFVNAQLSALGAHTVPLTRVQFDYAQSLIAAGTAAEEATEKARNFGGQLQIVSQFQTAASALGATKSEIDGVSAAMVRAATTVPESSAAIQDLHNAYVRGALSAEDFRGALDAMVSGYEHQAAAAGAAAGLEEQRRGEIMEGASASREAAAATDEQVAAMERLAQQGGEAIASYAETQVGFLDGIVERRAEHEDRIAELVAEKGEATTEAARQAIDKRIAAENEGYAKSEQAAAESFAKQQQQQNEHLAGMLGEYVLLQKQMGKITGEQADQMIGQINQQFGVIGDSTAETFAKMQSQIDDWAAGSGESAAKVASDLTGTRDAAVETQAKMEALAKKYEAELITNFEEGKITADQLRAKLQQIPARVYSEVVISTTKVETTITKRGTQDLSGAAGGGTFMTHGPTTLVVGDNPGGVEQVTVTPISGTGQTTVAPGSGLVKMAGGGTVTATGGVATTGFVGLPDSGAALAAQNKTQQKLLQDQQKYYEKALEAAQEHNQRIADIQADFQEKLGEQLQSNELSKRFGKADFYDDLTRATKDIGPQIAQNLSGAYEEAYAKSQEIAQAGNAKLAADYLELRQDQIGADLDYEQQVAQIKEDGVDAEEQAELGRMAVIKQMRDEARAEELNQLMAGGDDIVQARDEALSEEEKRYQEQQQQIAQDAGQAYAKHAAAAADAGGKVVATAQAETAAFGELASAVENLPDSKTIDVTVNYGTSGTPPPATVGATVPAMASGGPVSVGNVTLVGEEGPELVVFGDAATVIPAGPTAQLLSSGMADGGSTGGGAVEPASTSVPTSSAGVAEAQSTMAAANSIAQSIAPYVDWDLLGVLNTYRQYLDAAVDILNNAVKLINEFSRSMPSVDMGSVHYLANVTAEMVHIFDASILPETYAYVDLAEAYGRLVGTAIDTLSNVVDLREKIASANMAPLDLDQIRELAQQSKSISEVVTSVLLPYSDLQAAWLQQYKDTTEQIVGILTAVAGLRDSIPDPLEPLDMDVVQALAINAQDLARLLQTTALPVSDANAEMLQNYADAVGGSVGILNDVISLSGDMSKPVPPIDPALVQTLADQSLEVGSIVGGVMVNVSEELLAELESYASAVGGAVNVLTNMQQLSASLSEPVPPINVEYAQQLADQTLQVGSIVGGVMVPVSEEANATLQSYVDAVGGTVQMLSDMQSLAADLAEPVPPINAEYVQQLAFESQQVLIQVEQLIDVTEEEAAALQTYANASQAAVGVLTDLTNLAQTLAEPIAPINPDTLSYLTLAANDVLQLVYSNMIPVAEEEAAALQIYADANSAAMQPLNDLAALAGTLAQPIPPISPDDVVYLSQAAADVTQLVYSEMIPVTEEEAAALQAYSSAVSAAVQPLSDLANLARTIAEPIPPINPDTIAYLSEAAADVTQMVYGDLLPVAEEEAAALQTYAGAVGSSTQILNDMAGVAESTSKLAAPIDMAAVEQAAAEAQQITMVMLESLLPVAEEEAAALQRYADTVGSSTQIVNDVLNLSGKLFADYVSPTDAQLDLIVTDAERVVSRVAAAASVYSQEGMAAAKAYADTVGATFGAFKEGLLFFDALRSGDFTLNPDNLQAFEDATLSTLETMRRLGAVASTIPAADIAALQETTAALNAQTEALINLAAVPYGDLPASSAAYAASAGTTGTGGTTITGPIYLNVYSTDPTAAGEDVLNELNSMVSSYA